MKFRNFTPHSVCLNDGRQFGSEGVARVQATFTEFNPAGICKQTFGEVTGLPPDEDMGDEAVFLIVSSMVLAASDRRDLVAPATGHPDTIRDEKGHIVSVPGFVWK